MKIQRENLLKLNAILQQAERIFKAPISGKFYYTVTRNRNKAEEERKICYEAYPVDDKYIEYDRKRREIFIEEGITSDLKLRELSVNDRERFNAIQEKQRNLMEEYKEAIDVENKMAVARNEFFKEDLDIDLRTISSAEIPELNPDSGINGWEVFSAIEPILVFPQNAVSKTVKREKLLRLNVVLQQVDLIFGKNVSIKFFDAVKYNLEKTEDERKLTYQAYPVDQKYFEYDQNRRAIFGEEGITNDFQLRELAMKDPERFKAIQERQRKLISEYKEAIDAENAMSAERGKYLNEDVAIDLKVVSMDDLPEFVDDEHINTWEIFDALAPMIDFSDDSNKE